MKEPSSKEDVLKGLGIDTSFGLEVKKQFRKHLINELQNTKKPKTNSDQLRAHLEF